MHKLLRLIVSMVYRVRLHGIEHFPNNGQAALIIANHCSFLDGVLLALFLPNNPVIAINSQLKWRWWMFPLKMVATVIPMDPFSPEGNREILRILADGGKVALFPEGRITTTTGLMKIMPGVAAVAQMTEASIIPICIQGTQFTLFSPTRKYFHHRFSQLITLTITKPIDFTLAEDIKGSKRAEFANQKLYDIMSDMLFETSHYRRTLFESLLNCRHIYGKKHIVAEDFQRQTLTYNRLITGSFVLGMKLAQHTDTGENVGLLLPNTNGALVTFFALQATSRIPVMLNYTVGEAPLMSSCQTAALATVITSRLFIEKAELSHLVDALVETGMNLIYLEDIKETISTMDKLSGLWQTMRAAATYKRLAKVTSPDGAAVILFTSGSEGQPKGVVLTHANLLANHKQLNARIDFSSKDCIFNALPLFHSFGLCSGTLLPVLSGMKVFFYLSPLHYQTIPALVYDSNATILFATDTFLTGYARYANSYDFHALRFIFAGAEKLKPRTQQCWSETFGIRILEGYGATETAPVLSFNTPMYNRNNTVGRLMPGIEYRLEKVPGIEEGGRFFVKGPNIMKGYLLFKEPGKLVPIDDGWYDTGDIVTVDDELFVTIHGRTKRFAKIGGEMISLTAVEIVIAEKWVDYGHAVVSIAHRTKGEQLILMTTHPDLDRQMISHHFKASGVSEISIPKHIISVEEIPVLGTGKTNYIAVVEAVNSRVENHAELAG